MRAVAMPRMPIAAATTAQQTGNEPIAIIVKI